MKTTTITPVRGYLRRRLALCVSSALLVVLFGPMAGTSRAAGDAATGAKKFRSSICVQCHGVNAQGVRSMGMDLHDAPLIRAGKADAIAAFIARGHRATNEFPGGMPADGGTSLTQQDRENIAAWLVTLPKSKSAD